VLKENVLRRDGPAVVDKMDSSVTRSDAHVRRLFQAAGLDIVAEELQKGMPADLYPIMSYALRPKRV